MNDYIRKAERDLAAATANIGVAESRALRAQVKTTQETLALSIGSYKDGQSSLLDVLDAQRSVATSQAKLAQAVQQMAKDYVTVNAAIGSATTSVGPRSGQILMDTEPHAVAAMDKRWIASDNPPFGRVS
ncbi:TolC family protein [Rhizobium johnstonii]|uniref:TolC family protein n=1 Tax=Rhizobium johnstonii TaxID=3019933 RepID=UPI001616D6E3|nr:multidrug efflux system outer membrane protein [Rhizobium leguminosarum]